MTVQPPLEDAIDDAFFHDMRLWFRFTDDNQHLGSVTQARRTAALVATKVAGERVDELREIVWQLVGVLDQFEQATEPEGEPLPYAVATLDMGVLERLRALVGDRFDERPIR
jgi:hypothetical protein